MKQRRGHDRVRSNQSEPLGFCEPAKPSPPIQDHECLRARQERARAERSAKKLGWIKKMHRLHLQRQHELRDYHQGSSEKFR